MHYKTIQSVWICIFSQGSHSHTSHSLVSVAVQLISWLKSNNLPFREYFIILLNSSCFCIVSLVFFRVHIRPLEGSSVLCLLFVRSGLLCRLTLCFCLALLHFLNNYQKSHRRHRHLKKVVMIGSVNPIPNSIKLSRSDVMLIQIVVSILLRKTY